MVLQGHVARGGVEIAQTTTTIPGKPTDGFGAGFQTLSGVVMDPAGAVVPNATVGLVNTDTKAAISPITTDTAGRYMFQHMDVGTYDLTISAPGFKRETQTGIHVAAGEAHNGGTTMLQLGAVRESITVTGSRSAALAAGPTVAVLGPVTTLTPAATLATVEQTQAVKKQFVEQFWLRRDASAGSAGPIKVGGNVQAANLINAVKPVYPVEPLSQGIQGTVKIEALISKGGTADNLQVISSPDATLTQAALNAVKLWRYRPTMLDGEPVETMTTIDVNYSATE
jgi:TonB family protein